MKKIIIFLVIVIVLLLWSPWMTEEYVQNKAPDGGYWGDQTKVEWFPFGRQTVGPSPNAHQYVVLFWGIVADTEVFD